MIVLARVLPLLILIVRCSATRNYTSWLSYGSTEEKTSQLPIRLPSALKPSHYFVRLQPYINGNLSFDGYVEITMIVKEPTDKIILHINDIITRNETVKLYDMVPGATTQIPIIKQEFNLERQFYIVTLSQTLRVEGIYVLALSYHGYLNDNLRGFYRSSYTDSNGNTKMLATTQFQATDARRAFPCFDEPSFKAKFTIEMVREEGMSTISNMPRYSTEPAPNQLGWFIDRFNTTYPMSTYLVAFIVSDFGHVELNETMKSNFDYNFRVWARKDAVSQLEYAITLGPKISKFYETFFNVPFPLPKQDMAAVPDFAIGAMENWGLIIYRESVFLYDKKSAKARDQMRIASIIAHELAHQWFGDLVTPAWWNDIWLNEGFASYVEYLGLQETEPEMKPLEQFIVTDLHKSLKLDSLETSHPISLPVNNPDEINQIFDAISYSKGASIIRMMSSFLTEESFKKGLTNYLTKLSYSNADQDDLWRYLTEQAHEDKTLNPGLTVKDVMDTWTLQMGYPVVTVERINDGTALLKQKRFLMSLTEASDTHDYKWWIPITFTTEDEADFSVTTPTTWMSPEQSTKTISRMPMADKWVIFNRAQTGYYRVNYDENNWKLIIQQLATDHKVISNMNKAQLIDDSMNLARAGLLNYDIALELLSYIGKETDFVPIKAALDNLDYIKGMFSYTGQYGSLKNYLSSLITPLYDAIKFDDHVSDPHLEQRKREIILNWACDLGHQPCIEAAKKLYSSWMKNPDNYTLISPNLKGVVYCTAISEGGDEEWMFAWNRYIATDVGTEKMELLEAMACSKSIWILNEYLNRALTAGNGIRKQDVRYVIPAVARTNIGRLVAWQFLKSRWGDIIDYFGSSLFILTEMISSVTSKLNTKLQLEEVIAFKASYRDNFASAQRTVEQALETTKNNILFMDKFYGRIGDYLNSKGFTSQI